MFPMRGLLVKRYTSSKYSLVNSNGFAVTFGMYFPTNLPGSMEVLLIFFSRKDRKGFTPLRRKVLWKGTSMPLRGMVAKPRWSSMGLGFLAVSAAQVLMISTKCCLTSSSDMVCMSCWMSIFWALR